MAAQELGLTVGVVNPTPIVHDVAEHPKKDSTRKHEESNEREEIDAIEILELIRNIKDPEYPYSLEQLNVVSEDLIKVDDKNNYIHVNFTPTVEHCSLATLIGLCIRVQLMRSLPQRFKVDIEITKGAHQTEDDVNKQLCDKERYSAAMENPTLRAVVEKCLADCFE